MPGLMKRNFQELKAKMDLEKINLIYVHQISIRIKRTLTIPLFPIQTQTLIMIITILMMKVPQMIHLATCRKSHNLKKIQKMKLRVISNPKLNPLTKKNLQTVILEEVVLTLLMKNPRKEVVTATNLTKDQRMIPMICFKNLNQKFQNLVPHCKPLIKYGSAYGNKHAVQIERELKSDKAWQKAVEPKVNAMIKQAHNMFHDDLETIIKEGGNKSIYYLLAQAAYVTKYNLDACLIIISHR